MKFEHDNLAGDESIRALSAPLLAIIAATKGLTELSMSKPGVFFLEISGSWHRREIPEMDANRCRRLVEAISYYVHQEIKEDSPLLSTTLPTGERIQVVIPPACDPEQIVISIRVPDKGIVRTLQSYEDAGAFSKFIWIESPNTPTLFDKLSFEDRKLINLLREKNLLTFLCEAVYSKKTIAVIGDTGSGKTTLMKSLCQVIPTEERLLTIEDARELSLPSHENSAHLLYAKGGTAALRATPADLIAACMRLKPDRVLLAELRGSEAWDFLKLMTTGHAGSITSFHAKNCAVAADRWAFMCKEHKDAGTITAHEIKELVSTTVDVILHITFAKTYDADGALTKTERYVTEVKFDPAGELAKSIGDGVLYA